MQKPTQEEIDVLLECAKVVGGNFARLADAYRAKCEDEDIQRIRAIRAEARAEMLERQYGELAEHEEPPELPNFENKREMLVRHTAEREALK